MEETKIDTLSKQKLKRLKWKKFFDNQQATNTKKNLSEKALTMNKQYKLFFDKKVSKKAPVKKNPNSGFYLASSKGISIKEYGLKRRYNMSLEEYEALLINQDHSCKICKVHADTQPKGLFVDHSHDTLKVRGLLCSKCNISLGGFKDSLEILIAATKYLLESQQPKEA